MITKLWWNCKILQQTKQEPQSTLKLQIVACLRQNEEAMKKLKEEQKSNGVESSFGDKEICSEQEETETMELGKKIQGKTHSLRREERDGSQSWCGVTRENRKMIERKPLLRHCCAVSQVIWV